MKQVDRYFFDSMRKAQEEGDPIARYIKAIVGRVCVSIIDPFSAQPTDVILTGDPAHSDTEIEDITITLWTDMGHEYFRRANKILIQRGYIAPYTAEVVEEISVNEIEDAVLVEALKKKYFATAALLKKFTSPVPVMRMLRLAQELNKPIGTISAIQKRLSELQRIESEGE